MGVLAANRPGAIKKAMKDQGFKRANLLTCDFLLERKTFKHFKPYKPFPNEWALLNIGDTEV